MFTFAQDNRSWSQALLGIVTAVALAILLATTGCGSSKIAATAANTQLKVGDAPADSVIAFELTITSVSLTSSSGNSVTVFSGSSEIELAHLAATLEPVAFADVPPGTYTKATIGFNGAEVTYIPTTATTPVEKQFAASGTITVTPSSPVTIGNGSNVLSVDVNLAQSLTFDASGNVTAINPVFTISSVAVAAENEQEEENGALDDAVGTVSAAPANNSFVLTLQLTGQSLTFNVDGNTQFSDGINSFADIKQGMLLSVDATTGANGAFNAKEVELVEPQGSEAEGLIISTTNPLTQFTIVDADGAGSGMTTAEIGQSLNVNVTASTQFGVNTDHIDLSGLSFGFNSSSLVKGQMVEVESTGAASVGAITADKVKLSKQALSGSVSAAAITGSVGTFTLTLPGDSAFAKLTGLASVTVHQQTGTELKGIAAVSNGSSVKVRGLLFWDGANYQFVASRITTP